MASSSPTLEEIIIASKRDEASVLNVFLVGSRAWGTETADSDWDYFVVVEETALTGPLEMTDDGRINLTIFSTETWRRWLVKEHNLQGVACLFLPSSNVLLNRYDWSTEFVIDRKRLRFSALRKASSSFNRARIYWLAMQDMFDAKETKRIILTEDDEAQMKGLTNYEAEKKSKKMIVHGLRTIELALQLFEYGKIVDLHCGRKYWEEIKDITGVEWQYFADKYESLWKKLADQFPADSAELPGPSSSSIPKCFHRLDYLLHLPSFQSSYREGISKEMFSLIRDVKIANHPSMPQSKNSTELSANNLHQIPLKESFETYFPKFPILMDVYDEALAHFEKMVSILQTDYDSLIKAATAFMEVNNTKLPREIAAIAKGVAPHYTLLFGISKNVSNASAEIYLLTCPLTHFDMMEQYAKEDPQPMKWPTPAAASSTANSTAASSSTD